MKQLSISSLKQLKTVFKIDYKYTIEGICLERQPQYILHINLLWLYNWCDTLFGAFMSLLISYILVYYRRRAIFCRVYFRVFQFLSLVRFSLLFFLQIFSYQIQSIDFFYVCWYFFFFSTSIHQSHCHVQNNMQFLHVGRGRLNLDHQ